MTTQYKHIRSSDVMATHQWKLLKEGWVFKMALLMRHMEMKRRKLLFKVISMYRRSLRCCHRHVDAHVSRLQF